MEIGREVAISYTISEDVAEKDCRFSSEMTLSQMR